MIYFPFIQLWLTENEITEKDWSTCLHSRHSSYVTGVTVYLPILCPHSYSFLRPNWLGQQCAHSAKTLSSSYHILFSIYVNTISCINIFPKRHHDFMLQAFKYIKHGQTKAQNCIKNAREPIVQVKPLYNNICCNHTYKVIL